MFSNSIDCEILDQDGIRFNKKNLIQRINYYSVEN